MSTVSNSVKQCQTVSTVSTVIARCYLHLRWYFWWLWRVGCISQDTYLLYMYETDFTLGPLVIGSFAICIFNGF